MSDEQTEQLAMFGAALAVAAFPPKLDPPPLPAALPLAPVVSLGIVRQRLRGVKPRRDMQYDLDAGA